MKNHENKFKEQLYESIYRKYSDDIYRLSLCFLKDEETAKKVTQQVFFSFYESFEKIAESDCYSYLIGKTKQLTNDIVKKKYTEEEVNKDD